jgi:indolepyruvate ferredoxin oxidoreductase alpha subunit
MHEEITRVLVENEARLIYATNKGVGKGLRSLQDEFRRFHYELCTNEKIAYELALAGSYTSKRTVCLISSEGLYEALDAIMSSAYTGAVGGFLVVCVQENDVVATPVGPFAKLPFIVTDSIEAFRSAVEYGYMISEKYETPVIIQAATIEDQPSAVSRQPSVSIIDHRSSIIDETGSSPYASSIEHRASSNGPARFVRDPNRWAATPKFRYQLHRQLNEKIEKIRKEFEEYEGNHMTVKTGTGVITDKISRLEFYDEDGSILRLATLYPLPEKLVSGFIDRMDSVFVEEEYPVIELQVPDRSKVRANKMHDSYGRQKPEEMMYGMHVVRDKLGPASSINMAHGIKKLEPRRKVLAITYEDFFFHSGMPAFVNTLYNDSSYVLLIMTNRREDELKGVLKGFGFDNCHHLDSASEIERFKDANSLTVLFCRGIL